MSCYFPAPRQALLNSADNITSMKIIQSSNVRLGAAFSRQDPTKLGFTRGGGQAVSGDKLRVAIKNAFVRLIDLTIA